MSVNMTKAPTKGTRTYAVTVEARGDGATVTVNGTTYRYPWHWSDTYRSLARRAVTENYRVDHVESIEDHRRGRVPLGSFFVTARVF